VEIWGGIGRGMRGFLCGMVRGVSTPREGPKILTFLLQPRQVCSSLLHAPKRVERLSEKGVSGIDSLL
jgi:hypothetical protein